MDGKTNFAVAVILWGRYVLSVCLVVIVMYCRMSRGSLPTLLTWNVIYMTRITP